MTTDPLAAAIARIRRITVSNDPWTDAIHTLANAAEAERAKVAAAYEAADDVLREHLFHKEHWARRDIRALTPADAQAALDKLLAEARLEGWRAGRDAAAAEAALYGCSEGADEYTEGIHEGYTEAVSQIVDGIRALPEPKEASYD